LKSRSHRSARRKRSIGLTSAPDLRRLFLRLNRTYFRGKLPADTIVKWGHISSLGVYSDSMPAVVTINWWCRKSGRVTEWILLHELAHLSVGRKERKHHGPKWYREIGRLARAGAYSALF
jgi:hypothetical protein